MCYRFALIETPAASAFSDLVDNRTIVLYYTFVVFLTRDNLSPVENDRRGWQTTSGRCSHCRGLVERREKTGRAGDHSQDYQSD